MIDDAGWRWRLFYAVHAIINWVIDHSSPKGFLARKAREREQRRLAERAKNIPYKATEFFRWR